MTTAAKQAGAQAGGKRGGKGPVLREAQKGEEAARAWSAAAAVAMASLAAPDVAHAGWEKTLTPEFWIAFLQWRASSPLLFIGTFVVPTGGLYLLFKYLLDKKRENFRAALEEKGWDTFLKERGVDIYEINDVPQLRYFVRLMERNLLDEQKVDEFIEYQRKKMEYYSPIVATQYKRAQEEKAASETEEKEEEKAA